MPNTRKDGTTTRRAISMKGLVHQRFRAQCQREGVPMAGKLEAIVVAYLESVGAPPEHIFKPYTPNPNRNTQRRSGHVVF